MYFLIYWTYEWGAKDQNRKCFYFSFLFKLNNFHYKLYYQQ